MNSEIRIQSGAVMLGLGVTRELIIHLSPGSEPYNIKSEIVRPPYLIVIRVGHSTY